MDVRDVPYVPEVPHVTYVPVHQQTTLASEYFQSYSVVGLLALVGVLFVAAAFGGDGCCGPWSRRRRSF